MSVNRKTRADTLILLADDDPDTMQMYQHRLELEGYRVSTATDGEEALAEVRREQPDLVVLDLDMPQLHGLEVVDQLRRDERTKRIPVAILSGWQLTDQFGSSAEEMGLVAWLAKHETKPSRLATLVTEWLERLRLPEAMP